MAIALPPELSWRWPLHRSTDPLDPVHLRHLKRLVDRLRSGPGYRALFGLGFGEWTARKRFVPLPYTEEALIHMVARVSQVQDFLGRQILIENPSSYMESTPQYV